MGIFRGIYGKKNSLTTVLIRILKFISVSVNKTSQTVGVWNCGSRKLIPSTCRWLNSRQMGHATTAEINNRVHKPRIHRPMQIFFARWMPVKISDLQMNGRCLIATASPYKWVFFLCYNKISLIYPRI